MAITRNTPKFDRAAIMLDAWRRYRLTHSIYEKWQFDRGIIDGSFAAALRTAWRITKETAAKAEIDRLLASSPYAARAAAIAAEIDGLKYKTLRYDTAARLRRLDTEAAELRRKIEVTEQIEAITIGPIRFDGSAARASLQAQLAAL